jgi:hypothetical protein
MLATKQKNMELDQIRRACGKVNGHHEIAPIS